MDRKTTPIVITCTIVLIILFVWNKIDNDFNSKFQFWKNETIDPQICYDTSSENTSDEFTDIVSQVTFLDYLRAIDKKGLSVPSYMRQVAFFQKLFITKDKLKLFQDGISM